MRKKILLSILVTGLLAVSAAPSTVSWAASKSSLDKINQELKAIQQKTRAQKKKVEATKQQIASVQKQTKDLETELMAIDLRRNETQKKLDKLENEMEVTKVKAAEAQDQLDEAIDRVAKRDALLKTRVKVMYERGNVSYLDVLLGASDFGDFLTRMQGLKLILEQDTKILEDNKRDKDTIEKKKKRSTTSSPCTQECTKRRKI